MELTRRALLRGARETHFASLVVHCRPEHLDSARESIAVLPGAEVPLSDDSCKLVVLLEMENESALLKRMTEIEALAGVVTATMVFHQVESEDS